MVQRKGYSGSGEPSRSLQKLACRVKAWKCLLPTLKGADPDSSRALLSCSLPLVASRIPARSQSPVVAM